MTEPTDRAGQTVNVEELDLGPAIIDAEGVLRAPPLLVPPPAPDQPPPA